MASKNLVVLVNLGSPNNLSYKSIRIFLYNFLTDRRVVNLPKILWLPILFLFILTFRVKKLFKQYKSIWLKSESPLIYYSNAIATALQTRFSADDTHVVTAYSYSQPTLSNVISEFCANNEIKKLTIIPLFPQFSTTTTQTVFDQVYNHFKSLYSMGNINFISNFATHPLYIKAVANLIRANSDLKYNATKKLLFSFHGIPQVLVNKGDPYFNHCCQSATIIAQHLGLTADDYLVCFQSKFGSQKWLTPSTVESLKHLAQNKVANVDIICPGFICDCLETLEEIAIINKQIFIVNGGVNYNYIQCLNASSDIIDLLYNIVDK
ncbi:MAG: ferrochelatase [Burkholderiales bacterium]|nr:ferrochelatase [Burkholderiales bacterium]